VIVVDTGVWIDVLAGRDTDAAVRCVTLIENGEPVALTEVVYCELLQGVRPPRQAAILDDHLRTSGRARRPARRAPRSIAL
jgi:predicted nucleic acid-binding protein